MKNYTKLIGIIAFVAVIGFSMAVFSCEDEAKDDLDGTTWKYSETYDGVTLNYVLTFNSPKFTFAMTGEGGLNDSMSGTYSISGSKVTMIGTTNTITGILAGNTLTVEDMPFKKQ